MARRTAVARRINELLLSGLSNGQIAKIVRREIPGSKTNSACVASYRCLLRKAGHDVMTSRQASKSKPKSKSMELLADVSRPAATERGQLHRLMQSWLSHFA